MMLPRNTYNLLHSNDTKGSLAVFVPFCATNFFADITAKLRHKMIQNEKRAKRKQWIAQIGTKGKQVNPYTGLHFNKACTHSGTSFPQGTYQL